MAVVNFTSVISGQKVQVLDFVADKQAKQPDKEKVASNNETSSFSTKKNPLELLNQVTKKV